MWLIAGMVRHFFYLLFLLALSWIGVIYGMQIALNKSYTKNSELIVSQMPVMTIKDGKLSTPEAKPYFVKDPETKGTLVVVDATGQYTSLEAAKAPVLVTQTAVISQTKPDQIRIDKIPNGLNMVVKPDVVNDYIKKYIGYTWILLFILFVIFSYILRLIQVLIYALCGLVFKAIFKVPLTYGQLIVITIVALTPVIVLSTILDLFGIFVPNEGLIGFMLTMLYLCFGILANKNPQ